MDVYPDPTGIVVSDFYVIYRPGPGIGGKTKDEAESRDVCFDLMNVFVSVS